MAKTGPEFNYTFINPNSPKTVEAMLRRILIEKLMAMYADFSR